MSDGVTRVNAGDYRLCEVWLGAQNGGSEGINSFIVVMDLENVFWNGVYLTVPLAAKRLQKPDQNK